MTLITRIATKKIQLVISDSLCGIRNAAQNRKCQKIHVNEKLLIARFGDFPTAINIAFKEFEKDFVTEKEFVRFKEVISNIANQERLDGTTNFLIIDLARGEQVLRIIDSKLQEVIIEQGDKLDTLPEWVFFSPIYKEDGEVDYEYQDILVENLNNVFNNLGIENIEELKPEQIEQLAYDFYYEIYFGRDLQKDFIGGQYIWVAYSIEGSPWHLNKLEAVYTQLKIEDIASAIFDKIYNEVIKTTYDHTRRTTILKRTR